MQILSHRGYWKGNHEKNQEVAFHRSFKLAFGTETDLRDLAGELVISHDPPVGEEITVEKFFQLYREYDNDLPLALNIKSDGLQTRLKVLLEKYSITNYFVFDMSLTDAWLWLNQGFRIFTRESEFEPTPYFQEQAVGIWIDCFLSDWVNEQIITKYLQHGKQVCLVSPELHHREYLSFWKYLNTLPIIQYPNLMICTDYPEEAKIVFR
ncbi:hypothetical protein VF14_30760 [Nostoc linckia z18]|jgi:hypothetical protein|uniref:Phosphodiesterase n=2 Tax=Nostoc linckia TaxID=92942 RepID=A0A9Q5ZDB7_NOSLI|nr:hypothetical protein [Nostoc linckia]PHK38880.1 hypothetical protein VF12_16415 [Nostoc linckia z15]PHK44676.1 hypothetical protein VF13_20520 [Nostoc linckia z16]PHJ63517.1 hypothetical protein VF02_14770 [Nostoc linckia z1]PHJ68493.1 hypothetical protein VF05_15460 [Nostoc linckia z3]PHJ74263.1 hypothetical protein VF03_14600 [Nostoc linckia z2]